MHFLISNQLKFYTIYNLLLDNFLHRVIKFYYMQLFFLKKNVMLCKLFKCDLFTYKLYFILYIYDI